MTGNMWRGDGDRRGQPGESRRTGRAPGGSLNKPQIYVHFEFGMSFSPRHPPKPHSVTYQSRGIKERDQRTRPALHPHGTQNAWLAQPTPHHASNMRPRALTCGEHVAHPPTYDSLTGGYSLPQSDPFGPAAESYHHHHHHPAIERGGSAPPPMCDSPWDAEPEPVGFSALPRPRAPPRSGLTPRLGNDGMPPSASAWPMADEDENRSEAARRRLNVPDSGLARDLASLSSAMMTVDNGFEDQWWYQGAREPAIEGVMMSDSPPRLQHQQHARSMPASPTDAYDDAWTAGTSMLGWAIADEDLRPTRSSSLRTTQASNQLNEEWSHASRQFSAGGDGGTPARGAVVSPMTEYYQPTPRQRTNSELWIYK